MEKLHKAQFDKRKVGPSINKLRNKLKDLEQVHSHGSQALQEREDEWTLKWRTAHGRYENVMQLL